MATKTEILKVLAILSASYPGFEMANETPSIYIETLKDIPSETLMAAAMDHISRSIWFPKVSELRKAAAEIAMNSRHQPDAYSAWGEVCTAIRLYGRDRKPDFANQITEKTVAALGWRNLCMSTNQVADRARFVESYKVFSERAMDEAITLPQVKELAQKLGGRLPASTSKELPESIEEDHEDEV